MEDSYHHSTAVNSNERQSPSSNMSLLSLINEVKTSLETHHTKKIEDLEYKILEKEETITILEREISAIKAQNEEKDLELFRLHEEINEGKRILEQLLHKLA
ncbi:hypothetical protein CQA66_08005 [Helicobacter aurati]|uniref:DUF904 domain-containing protein n=1 Tax=Helicobacter aurati TaxID=137778 RepID=A0A3D8J009_9HELI|nr:hypothetical protein [Helicobacter aurati]RDU70495.1 hypothetical protein CQA66_08005 [Helicobacter aurati]